MNELGKRKLLLVKFVEQLDEERVLSLARELLAAGVEPLQLLDLINEGMVRVGKLYEDKEYYIADLIMAGLIFKEILNLEPFLTTTKHDGKIGKVILGTVKGDIHDIGKDIFRGMLETHGFEVVDLGVDVAKEVFVKRIEEYKPDIVGLSGVLTYTVETMKEVVDTLIETGLRDKVKVLVGGNHLTEEACKYIGADYYVTDATVGVRLCQEWMNSRKERGATNDHESSIS